MGRTGRTEILRGRGDRQSHPWPQDRVPLRGVGRRLNNRVENSLRGPSVQPGTKPDIQAGIQGAARRGSGRVESTLRGLIQAGAGDLSGLFRSVQQHRQVASVAEAFASTPPDAAMMRDQCRSGPSAV